MKTVLQEQEELNDNFYYLKNKKVNIFGFDKELENFFLKKLIDDIYYFILIIKNFI